MRKDRRGFTLIEMLIVIAIISILAGVVLTGLRGFQANARDTRRIGDVRNTQNLLELYFNKCGHYPGDGDCGSATINSWDNLVNALGGAGIKNVPQPQPGGDYLYYSDADNLSYVLGAELEEDNSAIDDDLELPSGSGYDLGCGSADKIFCATSE
jgi:general secretion pathway protein G